MGYKKSTARSQFQLKAQALKAVIRASEKAGTNPLLHSSATAYAMLLLSAHMESYLSEVLRGWMQKCEAIPVTFSQLPLNMRMFLLLDDVIVNSYLRFLTTGDESEFFEQASKLVVSRAFAPAEGSSVIGKLPHNRILSKKYPSPDNLRRLFRRTGIAAVMVELNKRLKVDAEKHVESFNDVRTEIAHEGNLPSSFGASDAKRHIDRMTSVVGAFDRILFQLVCKETGQITWPGA